MIESMRSTCETCGEALPIQRAGRPPKYCSSACRQAGYRARKRRQLPREMIEADRWVTADGKRPVTADGRPASSTDPSTWGPRANVADGPHGFMLGAGFACIDLDGCIRAGGRVEPWARQILATVPTAFVERSVSGRGLHIFGLMPEGPGRNLGRAEYYSKARFIRVTGEVHRPGVLVALSPAVAEIHRQHAAGLIPQRRGAARRRLTSAA
jgi:primase-polymerase (primpol)-like protein